MEIAKKQPLVVILGPTAVGKTAFSVELAKRLNSEIISGDSMQFYRYMDIGTAKIRPQEMVTEDGHIIPHHLIDICDPDQPMSVADFKTMAQEKITEIAARGRLPMVVGGTGLYLNALMYGYQLDSVAEANEELRESLHREYRELGREVLHARLCTVDPKAAAQISPNDEKRLVRALEFFETNGQAISEQGRAKELPYDLVAVGLIREREELYRRIEMRVDMMMSDGFLAEVERLLEMGFSAELKPMQGLGYRQLCDYLAGNCSLEEAVGLIKRDTRRFAKRQLTWWRRDENINWLAADMPQPQLIDKVMAMCEPILS